VLRKTDDHAARGTAGGAPAAAAPILARPAGDRFHTRTGWLDSRHTFSFGHHRDPRWAGFRDLLVINDDRVAPAQGFGRHPHEDMEIVSIVLEGALEHGDSMGNGSTMVPGDIQLMSAGTGVTHSEWNPSKDAPVHFLQIWILPEREGLEPSYQQKRFPPAERRGRFRALVSRDGREGSVKIHQDAAIHAAIVAGAERAEHRLEPGRHAWVHVVRGEVAVNGRPMKEGDGAAFGPGGAIEVAGAGAEAEVLVFDLK
jgi:redox-sensitive bicupin YhaK (pirin superfamily)